MFMMDNVKGILQTGNLCEKNVMLQKSLLKLVCKS